MPERQPLPDRGEPQQVTDLRAADTEEIARLDALEGRRGRFHAVEDANEYIGILRAAHIEQIRRLRVENERLREALRAVDACLPNGPHLAHNAARTALASDENEVD